MIRNNQNRRRRGGGGNGPRPQQMNGGGNAYGNRLDNRQRGNASQLLEKYKSMARDAQQAGDRVAAEYYLQYADHYYRVLGDYRERQPEQNRQQRGNYYDDGGDGQFAANDSDQDDGEADGDEGQGQPDAWGNRAPRGDDRQGERQNERQVRDDRQTRDDRQPDARGQANGRAPDGERRPYRDNGARDQRPQQGSGDRPRGDWNGERPQQARDDRGSYDRSDRPRDDRPRDDRRDWQPRPARDAAPRREDQRDAEPEGDGGVIAGLPGPARLTPRAAAAQATVEPETLAPTAAGSADEPAPKRRGRPRKIVVEAPAEG